ncbi:MAG: hypothetical protein N2663_09345 [Chlorobi bacterium]|nr:hypothetical protein [Chlorobiota bacterium]
MAALTSFVALVLPLAIMRCLINTFRVHVFLPSSLLRWAVVFGVWGAVTVGAQQLIVADVDASLFPQLSMKLYSFDERSTPVPLDPMQDRAVVEYMGVVRQTLASVSCPSNWQPVPVSAVFALDWASPTIRSAAAAIVRQWQSAVVRGSTLGAVVFGDRAYLLADLSDDSSAIESSLELFPALGSAQPAMGLLDSLLGAVAVVSRGDRSRCIVVVTEHLFPATPPPQLVPLVRQSGARLIVIGLEHVVPSWLRRLCAESGGIAFDTVSIRRLPIVIGQAAAIAGGYQPCTVSWQSVHDCVGHRRAQLLAPTVNTQVEFSYQLGASQLPALEVLPRYRNVGLVPPGTTPPQEVILTARNADLTLLAITAEPNVEIVEGALSGPLLLRADQSYRLRVRLVVNSQQRTVGAIRFVTTACSVGDAAIIAANVPNVAQENAQFITPTTGTGVYAGTTLEVTWSGTLPSDSVKLLVQQYGDTQWVPIAQSLTETKFPWRVPLEGRYRFRLENNTGSLRAESETVTVVEPPFGVVPVVVRTARVGTSVEFQPPHLICSDTVVAVPIDSIRFVVGRAFSFAQRLADTLAPQRCLTGLLRFTPATAGMHYDTLEVYTPVGMRRLPIAGYAVLPSLSLPTTIRLDAIPLGAQIDTLVQWLVCSNYSQQVRLRVGGPDTTQIQLRTIREFSLTDQTPCLAYPFRFRADRLGRTCLRLLIECDDAQPYETVLIGDVVCRLPYDGATLAVPYGVATQSGRVVAVPVWLPRVPQTFRMMQRPYRFTVRCNASVLLPEPPLDRGSITEGERRFVVTGRGFLRGDTLALLRFSTYWGDAPITHVTIEDFQWLDQCPDGFSPVTVPVLFTDYCTAGGTTRLFIAGSVPIIERVEPQPSDGTMRVVLTTEHAAPVELACYDVLGQCRWRTSLSTVKGTIECEIHLDVPSGPYVLVASSPDGVSRTPILMSR